MKKIKLIDKGFGTKIKKGLVLTGNLNWDNGATYKGALKSQKQQIPHGYGIYFFPESEQWLSLGDKKKTKLHKVKSYVGDFKDGHFHGKGNFKSVGDYKYKGDFKKGRFHGKGRIEYSNGDIYEGDFINDSKSGKGKWIFSDGDTYKGNFKKGRFHGKGRIEYSNGDIYEGDFINDKVSKGKMLYKNSGQKYIGEFNKNGAWDGQGKAISKIGQVYTGTFKNGKRHGYGYSKYKKNSYRGQFVKNLRSGFGIFNFSDGGIYNGKWKNDTMHGKGTITETKGKKAGTVCSGIWKNGDMDGIYVFKSKSGNIHKEVWKKDKFIKIV